MIPKLAKTADDLYNKSAAYTRFLPRYLEKDDDRFIELLAEADELGRDNGGSRSVALIRIYGLAGDREKVDYYFDNACRVNADPVQRDLAQISALLGLGYFSEASSAIRKFADSQLGLLNLFLAQPPSGGMFHFVEALHLKAKTMNLTNVPELPTDYAVATAIMNYWDDSDDDYSAALDIAGKVMRSRKLFYGRRDVVIAPVMEPSDGSPPYIKMAFQVDVDLETAIDMTCEYTEGLARADIKIPQSLVFEFLPSEA